MPELPEVETVIRSVEPKILNKKIESSNVFWIKTLATHNEKSLNKLISNCSITSISRRGKYIILHLETGFILIHLRMTGKLIFENLDEKVQLNHLRFKINFSDKSSLNFIDIRKFGRIEFHQNIEFLNKKLGIEPFSKKLTPQYLLNKLSKRTGPIKSALLNQSIIAGIGNIYADEILWKIQIHPNKVANKLSINKLTELISATQETLQQAIDAMGTTFINFSFDNGSKGNYGTQLNIFNKKGKNCNRCSKVIKKIKCAGRGTYFCSSCQKI